MIFLAYAGQMRWRTRAGDEVAARLGLPPIPVSAEHGEGLSDLHEALARHIEPMSQDDAAAEGEEAEPDDDEAAPDRPLLLAIVGRPNVGKSTLLNRLVGEERVLTGPEAGITRDAIRVEWQWNGRPVRLVDTAGMRRRSRIETRLEEASVADTLEAIRLSDVVVVVLDATNMAEKQDLAVAGWVIEEGRALVIAVNKTDLLPDQAAAGRAWRKLADRLEASFDALDRFVADASHELRTPLTSLRTNIEVLASERTLPAGERGRLLNDVVDQLGSDLAPVRENQNALLCHCRSDQSECDDESSQEQIQHSAASCLFGSPRGAVGFLRLGKRRFRASPRRCKRWSFHPTTMLTEK